MKWEEPCVVIGNAGVLPVSLLALGDHIGEFATALGLFSCLYNEEDTVVQYLGEHRKSGL